MKKYCDKPSSLTQGIIELGKINATMYLLSYVDDEDYRRRILTQLNRGESRNGVARNICHGKRGKIRQRYQEGWNYIMNSPENLARIAGTEGLSALNLSVNDFAIPDVNMQQSISSNSLFNWGKGQFNKPPKV